MYKMLISDFEDTLLDLEEAIPLSTMLALDGIRNKKIKYTVISDNSLQTVLDYNKDFPFIDYIVVLNGSYVYDVKKKSTLVDSNIPINIVKKIDKLFNDKCICFYTLDYCNYIGDMDIVNGRKIGDFKVFSNFHKNDIYKIDIYCSSKKEQLEVIDKINSLELDIVCNPKKNNKYYVEILMKDCNRLEAINSICEENKIKLKDCVFVGCSDDNTNLVKKVGLSVAVDNASNKLKKSVEVVTVSNSEKAVEKIIGEYFK